jgi:hypothetical protein
MIIVYVVVKIFTRLNKIGDPDQSRTLAGSTKPVIERVVCQPYVSIYDEYRLSDLCTSNFERPVPQYYLPSHFQKIINELRAGDSRLTQAVWLLITI